MKSPYHWIPKKYLFRFGVCGFWVPCSRGASRPDSFDREKERRAAAGLMITADLLLTDEE